MGVLYIYILYIHTSVSVYIYIFIKIEAPQNWMISDPSNDFFFGRVDQPGCCDVRSPSRCRQTTLAAPFIPRRKTLLVGYIWVYMGFIWVDHVYMIWGFP